MIAYRIFQLPMGRTSRFIPMCRGIPGSVYPSWLSLADVFFINSALPDELRKEWRFLFSTRIHGESFSRFDTVVRNETVLTVIFLYFSLLGAIIDKGPSIIVIKDQDGYIFGGFASTSWTISPQFTGMYPSWSSVSSISTCVSLYLQDRRKISSSPWHRKWPSTLRRVSMITISISISNSKHSQTDW